VNAADKIENAPIVGAIIGVVEAPYSMVKNIVECKGVFNCLNIPKSIGKGLLNGAERVVLSTVDQSNRNFGENGQLANNKIASEVVGWAAAGFAYGAASGVGNTIFGAANRIPGWAATGAIVGVGMSGVDVALNKGKFTD